MTKKFDCKKCGETLTADTMSEMEEKLTSHGKKHGMEMDKQTLVKMKKMIIES